jgi:diguanylate cyclase (GGDEF)-like protein
MNEHKKISITYGILLIAAVIFCICGFIFIPVRTNTPVEGYSKEEIQPTSVVYVNEDVREFHFDGMDWDKNGSCLYFISSHQNIQVVADEELLFQREKVNTIWGNTPGYACEYIEIPAEAQNVTVTVISCYPIVRNMSITFYQGTMLKMFKQVFRQEGFNAIISTLNVCLGIILFIYGTASHKRTSIGSAMVYLGLFTILLGIWSITENGIVAVLVDNRAACSFVSFTTLTMIGLPFVMFVRCYLMTTDKYLYKVLLGINIANMIGTNLMQLLDIADMKETLPLTHLAMMCSVLYLPVSMVSIVRQHRINRRFWVTVCSLFSMCPPLAYSLILYYCGSHNVDSYGNVFLFVFVAIFAVDVSMTIMRDIDAGKKAAIYQELAEKDLLTNCYNRNAYKNDTSDWENLDGVLLVTCDLNNLKQCNDTLGHAYGDKYITDSAEILKKIFGPYGKVYRIGGDEFCVIIPNQKLCDINQLLGLLVDEEKIYNATSKLICLQIACGYAVYDPKTDSCMEDIRNRADELMYANKKELKAWKIV